MILILKRFYILGLLIAITLILSLYYHFDKSKEMIYQNTQKITSLSNDLLEREIRLWLSTNGQIIADAADYIMLESGNDNLSLAYLKKLLAQNPAFSSLYFGSTDNLMLNASGWKPPSTFDLRTRPWYVKAVAEKQIVYSQAFVNGSKDDLIITIAKPVYNSENKLLGVVGGDVSLKTIIAIVRDKKISEHGYSFLLDGKNNILAHPNYKYDVTSKLININEISAEIDKLIVQNKAGFTQVVMNGIDGYLAYKSIENTDWKIGSFIPVNEYSNIIDQQNKIFFINILMLILVFLLFIWLQKRYVLNPILILDKNIRQIDIEKNLSYRLPVLTNDEFASLDQSINRVLDKTQEYFLKIEKEEEALQRQYALLIENERKLKESENRWNFALEGAGDGVWDWNVQTNEVFFSLQWKCMLGYEDAELPNVFTEWDSRIHPDDKQGCYKDIAKYLNQETMLYKNEHRLKCKDGSYKWILARGKIVEWTEEGKPLRMIGTNTDISNSKAMANALATEKDLLKMTLLSVGDGVITTDNNGKITMLNQVAEETTGWTEEESIGKNFEEIFHIIDESTGEKCENPLFVALDTGKRIFLSDSTVLIAKDGTKVTISDSVAPIKDLEGNIKGAVVIFRDVTLEKKRQEQIQYLSYHDQLTGLYNRSFFDAELNRLDTNQYLPLTIIIADVNGLKITNDAFGHIVGDNLLKKSAEVLRLGCREGDIIARLGGDEFIILLPKTTQQEAGKIIQQIKMLIAETHIDVIAMSIAFGFATKNDTTEEIQEILKQADHDMYKNKALESHSMKVKLIDSIQTLYQIKTNEEGHSKKVSELCRSVGLAYHLSEEKLHELELAGLWHDIGKVDLEQGIVNKVGDLSETEWIEIKKHPEIGSRILKSLPTMYEVASYVLAHHEKWDGTGYPKGLAGEKIPWVSRVIAIAEAYETMCSGRPYQKAFSKETALEELKKNAGTQFDSDIVQVFIEMLAK